MWVAALMTLYYAKSARPHRKGVAVTLGMLCTSLLCMLVRLTYDADSLQAGLKQFYKSR